MTRFAFAERVWVAPLALLAMLLGDGAAARWPDRKPPIAGDYPTPKGARHAPPKAPPTRLPARWPAPAARPDRFADWHSIEPRKWPPIPWPPPGRAVSPAAKTQPPPPDPSAACVVRLAAMGIDTTPAALRQPSAGGGAGCIIPTPVRLIAVHLPQGKPVTIAGQPEVDCSMAERFGVFVREIVAPLAIGHLGTPLATISAGGFYCRPVDSIPGEALSPHGIGIAVDVLSFGLADGRRVDIGQAGPPEGAAFFKAVRTAACGYFTTVLGPGQPFHDTHMHVDLKVHGSSDRYRICQ